MDYDDFNGKDIGSSDALNQLCFESYLMPHLKNISLPNVKYFHGKSFEAWSLNINKQDIETTLFVGKICKDLFEKDKTFLGDLLGGIIEDFHNSSVRVESAERNLHNSRVSSNKEVRFERVANDSIELYHVLFESHFRLWSSIPYALLIKGYGLDSKAKDIKEIINVGSGKKFVDIRDFKYPSKIESIEKLLNGFDNKLRNALGGHESWEITDDDKILVKDVDPKTGKEKKRFLITEKDLTKTIKQARKTLWILEVGVSIFVENNPEVGKSISRNTLPTFREIKQTMEAEAKNLWLDIKEFSFDKDNKEVNISLQYSPKILGEKGQILTKGGSFDLIKKDFEVTYEEQSLGMIQKILGMVGRDFLDKVCVKVYDDEKSLLSDVIYNEEAIDSLMNVKEGDPIPKPISGEMTDKKYKIEYEIRIPSGMREFGEKALELFKNLSKEERDKFRKDHRISE